jgi:DNA-binding MarR family transcriptional regulator
VPSKNDRRINLIYLTRESEDLENRTMEVAAQTLEEALSGVSAPQVEFAREVLQKVYDNLR